MVDAFCDYPVEKMQTITTAPTSTPTTTGTTHRASRSSVKPVHSTNVHSNVNTNVHSTNYNSTIPTNYKTPSNCVYKSSVTKPVSYSHGKTNNSPSKYSNLATAAKVQSESNKYVRGVVMVAPQNDTSPGWIYSKKDNAMYQLPFSRTKHYIPEQTVLFNPTCKLRGLNLTEARYLMSQNKLNINNYNNYFVSHPISMNIAHTKLLNVNEINKTYLNSDSESIHDQNMYVLNTFINLQENNAIEFKLFDASKYSCNPFPSDKVIDVTERYLNGFVNMKGGTVYIGINDDGQIIGQSLYTMKARKVLDALQCKLCERLRDWTPKQHTQRLIRSVKIDMIDIIKIDETDNVGFVMPNKKIIKIRIDVIQTSANEHIIFRSSDRNANVIYVRHLSSLCAYTDYDMQQQIGKRQIVKINSNQSDDEESDIDFDDDDEKDWVHVDEGKKENRAKQFSFTKYLGSGYCYTQRISHIFQGIQNIRYT